MEATTVAGRQPVQPVFVADTLRGDVRDALLMHVRSMETPWSKLSEKQQAEKIEAIDKVARTVVRGSVNLVAQQGFPSLDVRVSSKGKYGDGGIEMACSAAFTSVNVTKIAEHGNGSAILVFAEPGEYFGERRAVRAEPDQHAMFRDGERDEEPVEEEDGDEGGDADAGEGAQASAEPAPTGKPTRSRNRRAISETEAA